MSHFIENGTSSTSLSILLRPLSRGNWEACAALAVAPEQNAWVAPNVYSIAEAQFLTGFSSLAVYSDETIVGYALFGPDADDGGTYWIYRLMIDARYQGGGYGHAAILRIVEEIAGRPDRSGKVRIGYRPDNAAARHVYAKAGFVEEGVAPWGEMIAAYTYPNLQMS